MPDATSRLGCCPFCGAPIPESAVIIEYEVDGDTRRFAECPGCEEPVSPA